MAFYQPEIPDTRISVLLLVCAGGAWVAVETAPYYLHRLTTFSDSLSAQQRFGVVLGFQPQDFLLGLHEHGRMPPFGFHNGLIYVVMMAGIGGICLLAFLIHRVAWMARPLGLSMLSVLALLAVFSQNGAILSPNKLVILSFLLIPLACVERSARASSEGLEPSTWSLAGPQVRGGLSTVERVVAPPPA